MRAIKTIFLIGMMGSGKSTVGSRVAALLSLPFVDTDERIEEVEGRSVRQIFEQEGETYFREKEHELLLSLPNEPCVVACGGGLPCFFDHIEQLKTKGVVVYLRASPLVLYERIKAGSSRPMLQDFQSFVLLLEQRELLYQKAHLSIDADQSEEHIVSQLLSVLASAHQ
jgi:shikimate kinase